jgi:glycine/serine hydroxymethyltransferase
MKNEQMETVVDFIDTVLMDIDNEQTIQKVSNDVVRFMKEYPLYWELGY